MIRYDGGSLKTIEKDNRSDTRAVSSTIRHRKGRPFDDRNGQGGALVPEQEHPGSRIECQSGLARQRRRGNVQCRTRSDRLHAPHGQHAAAAKRPPLLHRRDGGPGAALRRSRADAARQFHPHPQPAQVRRCHLYRGRLDVPAAQKRRHRTLQTAQGYRRHLLGRHVPALDRHRRRRVHHGQIHPKIRAGRVRETRQSEPPSRRQRGGRGPHPGPRPGQGQYPDEFDPVARNRASRYGPYPKPDFGAAFQMFRLRCPQPGFLPIYNYKKHKKSKVLTKQYFFNYDL